MQQRRVAAVCSYASAFARPAQRRLTLPLAALLYVTHIDWDHAWQRPQALASALARFHPVTVAAPVARARQQKASNPRTGLEVVRVWRLPGSLRSAARYALNIRLARVQLSRIIQRTNPRYAIVSAPECAAWIDARHNVTVVYDCMDDALAFTQDAAVRAARARDEQALLAHATLVVCSSEELARRCADRGARAGDIHVIPNGYSAAAFPTQLSRTLPPQGLLTLGYFGTIANWLDVALLERLVEALPDLVVRLVGPLETTWRPIHPRLQLRAPVRNAQLAQAVDDCDGMLMPFVLNDLTRAVDPIKLYEYIALGRPVLTPMYPALARFAPFVTFYRDAAHLEALLASRQLPQPPDAALRSAFLSTATWDARAAAFERLLRAEESRTGKPAS